MSVLRLASVFTLVRTPLDQVMAACRLQNVGASAAFSSTGGPSDTTATQPLPDSAMLKRPPASIPLTPPSTFEMSQSMFESNASTLRPLQVTRSFSSLKRWTSCARSARKTSPVPSIFISLAPSPVTAFLTMRLSPPPPACSKRTSP